MLFSREDIQAVGEVSALGAAINAPEKQLSLPGKHLRQVLNDPIVPTAFITQGKWSTHHLLEHLALKAGVCELYMSVYSISETPARKVFQLKNDGAISRLEVVYDKRALTHNPQALQLLLSAADAHAPDNIHAKFFTLRSEKHYYTVIASANWNQNKRCEAGVVLTDKAASDQIKAYVRSKQV